MNGWQKIAGTCDRIVLQLNVWDNRLGDFDVIEVPFHDVDFKGSYQDSPGVMYYADGSGEPPSCEWELLFDGDMNDVACFFGGFMDQLRVSGRYTLLESDESIACEVNDALDRALQDRVHEFVCDDEPDYEPEWEAEDATN